MYEIIKSEIYKLKSSKLQHNELKEILKEWFWFDIADMPSRFSSYWKSAYDPTIDRYFNSKRIAGKCIYFRWSNKWPMMLRLWELIRERNLKYRDFSHLFTTTYNTTADIFTYCAEGLYTCITSLQNKGGIRIKDSLGRIFYIKADQNEKTTLNLNEQLFWNLCDLHFWYCMNPKNQIKWDNWRIIVNLPCIANFKDQNELDIPESWTIDKSEKFIHLLDQARNVCPFEDFKKKYTAKKILN